MCVYIYDPAISSRLNDDEANKDTDLADIKWFQVIS